MQPVDSSWFQQLDVAHAIKHPKAGLWHLNLEFIPESDRIEGVLKQMPLIVIPDRLAGTGLVSSFREHYPDHAYVELQDQFDARQPGFGFPFHAAREVFAHLHHGGAVVVLEIANRPSGFLPALLTMLASPSDHPEKIIYPIRHAGYDLHPDQIGFIYGAADRRHSDDSDKMPPLIRP